MAYTMHLYNRNDEYLVSVRVLGGWRKVADDNGFDESATYTARVVAPATMRGEDLTYAIENAMSDLGMCGHSYDCCGCGRRRARVIRRPSRREYVVAMWISYNY